MPKNENVDETLVKVAARILKCSAAVVRTDHRRYAAFSADDGFHDVTFPRIRWKTLSISGKDDTLFWGRNDFDLHRSMVWRRDTSPSSLCEEGGEQKYLGRLHSAIKDGTIEPKDACDGLLGRIIAAESITETLRRLFMLQKGPYLVGGNHDEVDPAWESFVSAIEPPPLREHLGMFFQSQEAARGEGACFERGGSSLKVDGKKRYRTLCEWWSGEAQGKMVLTRIMYRTTDPIYEAPTPTATLKQTAKKASTKKTSTKNSTSLPMGRRPVPKIADLNKAFLAPAIKRMQKNTNTQAHASMWLDVQSNERTSQKHITALDSAVTWFLYSGEHQLAAYVAQYCAKHTKKTRLYYRNRYLGTLISIACWDEAKQVAEELIKMLQRRDPKKLVHPDNLVRFNYVYNNLAWAQLHLGELDEALSNAKSALKGERNDLSAMSTKASILFDMGRQSEAFKILSKTMKGGVDPEPNDVMKAHAEYRALATKYAKQLASD